MILTIHYLSPTQFVYYFYYICQIQFIRILGTIAQKYQAFIAEGGEIPFKELFNSFYEVLCKYAYGFMADEADANEVVLDFFLHLWFHRSEMKVEHSFVAYAKRSIHNRCLNKLRSKKSFDQIFDDSATINENEGSMDIQLMQDVIWAAVSTLPQKCKSAFVQSFDNGASNAQIASNLGVSIKSVERYKSTARKIILNALKKELLLLLIFLSALK